MFGRKKAGLPDVPYDPQTQRAILKCSICTGEQVAGFKDINTGRFTEVCLIGNEAELNAFMEKYGLASVAKEY